jgi:phosphate transport system substrate-binding protein
MISILKRTAICTALSLSAAAMASAQVRLAGAGATFPQPLYERWIAEYGKDHPDVKVDYGGGGSGQGIKGILDKTIDFAGSDAPMGKAELEKAGGADAIVEVPSCAGAVVPAYNLPNIKGLKFTGEVLAGIYMGTISNWNDPKIKEINDGVALPDLAITPAWRTDGSGTNYVFTHYLATQSDDFKGSIGIGKQVKWPVGQGGKGNPGVAAIVQQTSGAIGYIEQNYADKNNIEYGLVKNKVGKFVKASPDAVSAAGAGAVDKMKGTTLAADIWNQSGDTTYPISSFTYLIVYKDLSNVKSKEQAQALVDFMHWALHDGQKLASDLDYAPLAPAVVEKVDAAMDTISFGGSPMKASVADAK